MRRLTTSKGYLETHFKNGTFELRALRETGTTTKKTVIIMGGRHHQKYNDVK